MANMANKQLSILSSNELVSPLAMCAPAIKYAGSKRWAVPLLAVRLHALLAQMSGTFLETFAGGLAMGLALGWPKSVFADLSPDVANLYSAIALDADAVADALDELVKTRGTSEEAYYEIRREVWPKNRAGISVFAWAARMLYLNKVGFNGLLRSNRKGEFNVPWGNREGAAMPTREHLRKVAQAIGPAGIHCCGYEVILDAAERGEHGDPSRVVIFADPPYGAPLLDVAPGGARARHHVVVPASRQFDLFADPDDLPPIEDLAEEPRAKGKASKGGKAPVFTGYAGAAFTWEDQKTLAAQLARLARRGACVVATNTWTDEVCDLYRKDFALFQVGVRHSVGAIGARRGKRAELLAIDEAHAHIFDAVGADIKAVKR